MILRKIFRKNPEPEKTNNVFFKGAVIHTASGEVVSEDKNEVLKIINLLNGYLNGNEFQGNMLEKILNALNVNISESYICSGVLYGLDKPEGINVQSSPNWGNERPREADLCFKFSNGIDLSTFYAVHIIPNEATIDLYQITGTSTTKIATYSINFLPANGDLITCTWDSRSQEFEPVAGEDIATEQAKLHM